MPYSGPAGIAGLRDLWHAWNGLGEWPATLPDLPTWQAACRRWRDALLTHADLTARLLRSVAARQ